MDINKIKYSAIMFFFFVAVGALDPIISYYLLNYLNYSPEQVGIVLSLSSVSIFISPVIVTIIADKLISSKNLLILSCILGGGSIIVNFFVKDFTLFTAFYFLHILTYSPAMGLIYALIFQHYKEKSEKEFGIIRVWGVAGYIIPAWLISFVLLNDNFSLIKNIDLSAIFIICFLASILTAVFAFTLPDDKKTENSPENEKEEKANIFDSIKLIFTPQVLFIFIMAMLINLIDKYYSFGTSPFLANIGFPEKDIMAWMSTGQMTELLFTIFLGALLIKFGSKNVLIFGFIFQIFRYGLYTFTNNHALIIFSLALQGPCYALIYNTFVIEVDKYAPHKEKASIQQLFSMVVYGIGNTFGNYISGITGEIFFDKNTNTILFDKFWLVPLISVTAMLLIVLIFFKRLKKEPNINIRCKKMEL